MTSTTPLLSAPAQRIWRKAAYMSDQQGVSVGKVTDPRFGRVNTYHIDILRQVMSV